MRPIEPQRRVRRVFERPPLRRGHRQWRVLAAIALGGGLGSVCRDLLGGALGHAPWGTFVVNVSGCLVIGLFMTFVLEVWPPRRYVRPFWGVGFLGGYTTFSTYTVEIRTLLARGDVIAASGYGLGGLAAGLAAVWLGILLARTASRRKMRLR